jgi:hypothetical protein
MRERPNIQVVSLVFYYASSGLQTPNVPPLIGDDVAHANTLESCPTNAFRVHINKIHTHKRAIKNGGGGTTGGRNERLWVQTRSRNLAGGLGINMCK